MHRGARTECRRIGRIVRLRISVERLRQTEIQHFHFAFGRHLHVGGFQVAVNDIFPVRGFEGFCNLRGDLQGFLNRKRAGLQSIGQRLAGNKFHHETTHAVCLLQAVDRCDIRVVQRGQHAGFALETCEAFRIVHEICGKDFDGHVAPELVVVRAIHFTHSASADRGKNFVWS